MTEPTNRDEICKEMAGELSDIAGWLAGTELSREDFRRAVVAFEARKHRRFGLKLSSSVSGDRLVHFTLRIAATGEFCASLDVDPATGEMATQHAWV
jgi:hypothetical protein